MATHFEMSTVESCEAVVSVLGIGHRGIGYLHVEDKDGNTAALRIGTPRVAQRMAQVWADAKDAGEV